MTTNNDSASFSGGFGGRVRWVDLPVHCDERGQLLPLDFGSLPFMPRRVFTVTGTPVGAIRGEHGHRRGEQLLICLQGQIGLLLRKGDEAADALLTPAGPGLLVGAGVWCRQTYLAPHSVLLVLASEPYDPDSYLPTWD